MSAAELAALAAAAAPSVAFIAAEATGRLAPVTVGERIAVPMTTCLACDARIPRGQTWCSWTCRSLDDRHDADDYLGDDGDA